MTVNGSLDGVEFKAVKEDASGTYFPHTSSWLGDMDIRYYTSMDEIYNDALWEYQDPKNLARIISELLFGERVSLGECVEIDLRSPSIPLKIVRSQDAGRLPRKIMVCIKK